MSPIERVRARAEASEILGVGAHAGPDELRAAWRRIARELHPDQASGDSRRFLNARAAYDLLAEADDGTMAMPEGLRPAPERVVGERAARVGRPGLTTRTSPLGQEVSEACKALLREHGETSSTDHVPDQVARSGREVTYKVSTPLRKGVNRVAIPSDPFQGRRGSRPTILKFVAAASGAGEIVVPDGVRQQRFPGARLIRLEFACQ